MYFNIVCMQFCSLLHCMYSLYCCISIVPGSYTKEPQSSRVVSNFLPPSSSLLLPSSWSLEHHYWYHRHSTALLHQWTKWRRNDRQCFVLFASTMVPAARCTSWVYCGCVFETLSQPSPWKACIYYYNWYYKHFWASLSYFVLHTAQFAMLFLQCSCSHCSLATNVARCHDQCGARSASPQI